MTAPADEISSPDQWPPILPAVQVRITQPTDRLDDVIGFYRDGLGLRELFRFTGHDGYDGVIFGLPGPSYHLEFISHIDGSPCPAPSRDNLLVFYFDGESARDAVAARLSGLGHAPVDPENPYLIRHGGVTIEDPDGWRIVLMPAPVF